MNRIEEISLFASALAVIALLNWLAGDRSFRGRTLLIRQGTFWAACRWLGLGLWSASVIAASQNDMRLECAGFAGAMTLLFGTARQAVKANDRGDRNQQDYDEKPEANKALEPTGVDAGC